MRSLNDKLPTEKKYSQQDILDWLRTYFATGLSCDTFSDNTPWGPVENTRLYCAAILIDDEYHGIDAELEKIRKKREKTADSVNQPPPPSASSFPGPHASTP